MTAGTAQHQGVAGNDALNAVVKRPPDRPVVDEKPVGDRPQALARLVILDRDRLAGKIAAGGDDGKAQPVEQEMMQGRGRQHQAEPGKTGRDRRGDHLVWHIGTPCQNDDRAGRARQQFFFAFGQIGET